MPCRRKESKQAIRWFVTGKNIAFHPRRFRLEFSITIGEYLRYTTMSSTDLGLLAILEAKPGKQDALADFLNSGLALVARESGTLSWYAFRITDTSFGIYDTFVDEGARQNHLSGPLAQALAEVADELLANPPKIRPLDVLAEKQS